MSTSFKTKIGLFFRYIVRWQQISLQAQDDEQDRSTQPGMNQGTIFFAYRCSARRTTTEAQPPPVAQSKRDNADTTFVQG
jgi:hypothetical protein